MTRSARKLLIKITFVPAASVESTVLKSYIWTLSERAITKYEHLRVLDVSSDVSPVTTSAHCVCHYRIDCRMLWSVKCKVWIVNCEA